MLERCKKESEIELIDILNVFYKRKKLIFFGTVVITLIFSSISFILPKTYKISAIIEPGKRPITDQNGQIIDEKYIESSLSIRETIVGGAYNESLKERLKISEDEIANTINGVIKMALTNKIAIVTGGLRGIGRGIAEELMDEGADVFNTFSEDEGYAAQPLNELQTMQLI